MIQVKCGCVYANYNKLRMIQKKSQKAVNSRLDRKKSNNKWSSFKRLLYFHRIVPKAAIKMANVTKFDIVELK